MGSDRPRKREKNFSPEFCSYLTRVRKFQKNRKKNQKIKKSLSGIISSQTGVDRLRKRKKNFSPEFCSYPTRAREFQKK